MGGEEVLAQEQIFVAVAVEVGHSHSEDGSELSFFGQRTRFELMSAVEEDHRSERVRLDKLHAPHLAAAQIGYAGFTIGGMGRISFAQDGHGRE